MASSFTPINALHFSLEPGDVTHYEFVAAKLSGELVFIAGIPSYGAECPPLVIARHDLDTFVEEFGDVLTADYDSYRDVAHKVLEKSTLVGWLSDGGKVNPWTCLAAIICAVRTL